LELQIRQTLKIAPNGKHAIAGLFYAATNNFYALPPLTFQNFEDLLT
jgi:hypothetical protein